MRSAITTGQREILVVEDNPGDVLLIEEAFRLSVSPCRLTTARDGVTALAMLRREAPHADAPRPDVILLDINMPRKSGLEILEELKQDVGLRRIPVLVLTSSHAGRDIAKSYDLHANA
jgi:CheY-like chemotaxis protein